MRNPSARKKWYLSVMGEMARTMPVWSCSVHDLHWCAIDYPPDLKPAGKVISIWAARRYAGTEEASRRATGAYLAKTTLLQLVKRRPFIVAPANSPIEAILSP